MNNFLKGVTPKGNNLIISGASSFEKGGKYFQVRLASPGAVSIHLKVLLYVFKEAEKGNLFTLSDGF